MAEVSGQDSHAAYRIRQYLEATPCEGHLHDPKCELRRAAFSALDEMEAELRVLREIAARSESS